ncbi:MAG TPA: hypothetical protein PKE39_04475 [Ignavibacteria bacterium]|nr:hypothetical protein [Ignavibacteria bacterium]HMQ98258.1 hypothetical protein [Ignavibacteria bacterium]
MHPAKTQLIWLKKRAPLSPQKIIAFSVILWAVLSGFAALCVYNYSFHCVGAPNCTHSVQHSQYSDASAICSLVGVFAFAKSTAFAFSLPQRTIPATSAAKPKSAKVSAGFASLALPQPLPPLHTAFHRDNLSNIPKIIPVNSTLRNLIKNAILQKFVSIGGSIFAGNCKNCNFLCP